MIIETFLQLMLKNENNPKMQSSILMNLYQKANDKERNLIDNVFNCLCGWSFKTVILNTCMSHDPFKQIMAYGPLELPLHVDDTPLGKIALIRIDGTEIPTELLINYLD